MLRRIASGLLASAGALLLLLLALEAGFRVFGFGDDAMAKPHPRVGWVHIPARTFEIKSEDRALGRRARIPINALGLRDVERRAAKPPGVYRILVLGDSYVEAAQVPFESTLTRRLERALEGLGGQRVEVWNCGVAGYSTAQELLYLEHVGAAFHPDLVVLCFLPNNDVPDHVPEMASSLRNRPFYRLAGDSLGLDLSFLRPDPAPIAWLRTRSRVFGWVTTQIRVVRTNLRQRAESRAGARGIPHWLQLYTDQPDSLWSAAWTLTDSLLVRARDAARHEGAGFLLVNATSGLQVHPEARATWRGWPQWEKQAHLVLDAPERRVARLAAANGIDYLPLLPSFQEEAARAGKPLHIGWVGHWNSAGHALAARAIGAKLAERMGSVGPSGNTLPGPAAR